MENVEKSSCLEISSKKKPFKKLHHRNYKLSDMFDFVCFSRSKQKQVLAVGGRKTVKTHTSFWEKKQKMLDFEVSSAENIAKVVCLQLKFGV